MHVSLECVGMIWIFCMFCWIYTFLSTQRKKIVFFYYQMCVDVVWQNILVYSNIAQRSIQILDQYFKIYNIKITNNVEIWEPVFTTRLYLPTKVQIENIWLCRWHISRCLSVIFFSVASASDQADFSSIMIENVFIAFTLKERIAK